MGGTVLLGGGLRSPSVFLVSFVFDSKTSKKHWFYVSVLIKSTAKPFQPLNKVRLV